MTGDREQITVGYSGDRCRQIAVGTYQGIIQRVSHYPSHGKPEPRTSIEIVKVEGEDDPDFPLLKEPVEYIQVWNDKDSGGDYNGAIWWPKPPDGYRSLGHVVTKGYDAPKTDIIRCVRRDYCRLGELNELTQIWSDRGSGAKKAQILTE